MVAIAMTLVRGHRLRNFAYRFIHMGSAQLSERVVRAKVDALLG